MARRPFFKAASSFAAILILAAGCADQVPTAAQFESASLSAANSIAKGPRANVVQATYNRGTYAATIGPRGGRIDFGIGTIDFPAGALSRATRITATTDGEHLGVTFGPHGLEFPKDNNPILTLAQLDESLSVEGLRIVYVDVEGHLLEEIATTTDIDTNQLAAGLQHFSTYWMAAP